MRNLFLTGLTLLEQVYDFGLKRGKRRLMFSVMRFGYYAFRDKASDKKVTSTS